MTVDGLPVASYVPRGAGNRGSSWVGTHRNPVKVPPPTPTFSRKPWSEACAGGLRPVPEMSPIASCLRMSVMRVSEWFL